MVRHLDLTDDGKLKVRQRIMILERMGEEFKAEGDEVAATKIENLIAHIESEDLFHEDRT